MPAPLVTRSCKGALNSNSSCMFIQQGILACFINATGVFKSSSASQGYKHLKMISGRKLRRTWSTTRQDTQTHTWAWASQFRLQFATALLALLVYGKAEEDVHICIALDAAQRTCLQTNLMHTFSIQNSTVACACTAQIFATTLPYNAAKA